MTKPLKRIVAPTLYHFVDGKKCSGPNSMMRGDCTDLKGDCTRLWGGCTRLWGDCTGLKGNCTRLWGNLDEILKDARPCNLADWVEELTDD